MRRNSRIVSAIVLMLVVGYFVAQYTSTFWGVLVFVGMVAVLVKILMMNFSKDAARKNGTLAESIEFYGDKMSFTMSDKRVINVKKADVSRIVRYEDEMGYRFYLNDNTMIYYDFGQNLFTDKDITALVNELNFPNAKFQTVK